MPNRMTRLCEVPTNVVFAEMAIADKYIYLQSKKIKVNSLRMQTFFRGGTTCKACGKKASFFAVERPHFEHDPFPFHLNLYYRDQESRETLFTHDHIIPKSMGGKDFILNTQPMCLPCNQKKGNSLISAR